MFGWEFPPMSSGGLGTACYGLTKSLSRKGIEITFVLPYSGDFDADFLKLIPAGNIKIKKVATLLQPYMTSNEYKKSLAKSQIPGIYGSTLFDEVHRYTLAAEKIAEDAVSKIHGPVFHRRDIGTAALIEKRVEMMRELRG